VRTSRHIKELLAFLLRSVVPKRQIWGLEHDWLQKHVAHELMKDSDDALVFPVRQLRGFFSTLTFIAAKI
jgi:hypothetical protein